MAAPIAWVGAVVHPVSGPPIADGVVVVDGAVIVAVGAFEYSGTSSSPGFLYTSEVNSFASWLTFWYPSIDRTVAWWVIQPSSCHKAIRPPAPVC